ncbi:MAG TPA: transposase domain-containing protein [Streptosporangiaceae bacterium]|nr:transposase domain-containing protein [Streptosporangiaceae bacterium]
MEQTGVVAGSGALTDWISLGVLASAVPRDAVDDAIAETGKGALRAGGKLPPHVMVYLVMALALFADVILSFRVIRSCDLRHRVEDSVLDAMPVA